MVLSAVWEFIVGQFRKLGRAFVGAGVRSWMALAAGGYCMWKVFQYTIKEIKLSQLLVLTESHVVKRAISIGNLVFLRGGEGPWYRCNANGIGTELILDHIRSNPDAIISTVENDDIGAIISIGRFTL